MPALSRTFLLLAIGTFVLASSGGAQRASEYRVDVFTTQEGLPSQAITDFARTSDGYVWIAAGGILARFDGYVFRSYTQANTPALVRRVDALYAGLGDTLWILDEGNAVFAMAQGKVTEVVPASPADIRSITQDGTGRLLALGDEKIWGLRRGSVERDRLVANYPLRFLDNLSLPRDAQGRVWFTDSAYVIRAIDDPATLSRPSLETGGHVRSRSGEIFAVRARGALRDVVGATGEVMATFPAQKIVFPRVIDHQGRLWTIGASSYDIYERGRSVPVDRIPLREFGTGSRIVEGESGCIWMTETSLLRACRVPFRTVPLDARARHSIRPGPAGTVLSFDESGQAISIDAQGVKRHFGASAIELRYAIPHIDRRGVAWWSGALLPAVRTEARVRVLTHGAVHLAVNDPSDDRVVWYATPTHVYRARLPENGDAVPLDSVDVGGLVSFMVAANDGVLWAIVKRADLTSQVVRVAGGHAKAYTTADGLPSAALRAILPDADGTVWLGTYGAGIVRWRNGQFRAVTEVDGLGEDVVTSLLEDDAGNFWMGGNRSVHRVARRDLEAFLDGTLRRVRGVTYGQRDGLPSPETVGYAGVRDDAGRFWFPTIGGAAVVDPAMALALDATPPRVHVLGIRTGRDTVEEGSIATLTRGERHVVIAYTGIAMRNPGGVRYEYRLDGTDKDWTDAGTSRQAIYTNVGPGTHTFRVRAVNAGGIPTERAAMMQFIVPPAFHETPLFFVLLAAGAASLAWSGLRVRERRARRQVATLEQAVEERTAKLGSALTTVAAQADQLRSLDLAKSRFFANVSHEFRTPLSLIIGPVEDLRDGRSGDLSAVVRRRLDGIHGNARRLLQLVEQLLDVARLESGTLQLSAEVRDLVPLLRRLADSYASLAERRGVHFRLSCPVGGLRVRYDPDQMEKVIGNLVGNALKFTPTAGSVELRALSDPDGEMAIIEVQDTGPGIAPEHHARVFERFFQVDDSSRRAHEGTGIGLALVRELVELHAGSVTLRSALGEGSTFTVRLPISVAAGVTSAEHVVHPQSTPAESTRDATPTASSVIAPGNDAITVLVVEDNVELLEFLRDHLAERFRVLVAENGVRGLEMARAHVPDLIVSDVMMPGMDGQSLCEAIKGDAEIDFIPIILLTAKASRDARLAGLAGGADDYLTKPVDLAELLVRADNLIASRRRVRERWRAANQQLPSIRVPVKAAPRDASARALLESFTTVLASHLADEDFNVEAMAFAMGMGRSTMYRRLEPLLGKSPMDALWEYRLSQAAQWLAETSITVSEVAYGVGFKSVPHFCGKFRERYGETPSGYRRSQRATAAT